MDTTITQGQRALYLVGRALLGLYFIIPGITKITGWSGSVDYMISHQVPFVVPLLVLTIILQIGGGAALFIGYRQRLMAFVLAGLTLVISLYMHDFWTMEESLQQRHETQNFVKNMAIMAGLMFVAGAQPTSRSDG